MDYKEKIRQQAIKKKKKEKLIKEGIEKLKEQGVDTTEMEKRMLGYELIEYDKKRKSKLENLQRIQNKYPMLPLTGGEIRGVYQIKNTQTNKVYINCSKDIEKAWKQIIADLMRKSNTKSALQSDYYELGEDCFEFSILEKVDDCMLPLEYYKYKHLNQASQTYNTMNNKEKILYKIMKTFIDNNMKFIYKHTFPDCFDKSSLIFDFVVYKNNGVDIQEIVILHSIKQHENVSDEDINRHKHHYQIKINYCKLKRYKCVVFEYDDNGYSIIKY